MIKVQASVSKVWLNKQGGFVFTEKYYLDPFYRMKQVQKCHEFVKEQFPDYPLTIWRITWFRRNIWSPI